MLTFYARLSGGGGTPTSAVYAVTSTVVTWDDESGEPMFPCVCVIVNEDGEREIVGTYIQYGYIYGRCARITEAQATELAPDVVAYAKEVAG
jgi:hypothetical protein